MSAADEIERALASSDWEERERGVLLAGGWLAEAEEGARREQVIARLDALSQAEGEKWEVLYALAKALAQCHRDLSPRLDRVVGRLRRHAHGRVRRQAEVTRDGWQLQARSEAHRIEAASSVEARLRALRRDDAELAEEAEAIAQERFRLATVEATHDLKHRLGVLEDVFGRLLENMQRLGARESLWRPLEVRWDQHADLTKQILNDMQTWATRTEPTLHRVNVRAMVNLALQAVQSLFASQRRWVRTEVRVSADLRVWVDKGLIERALENVLKNAFEAVIPLAEAEGEPREVRIHAEAQRADVELVIEDDGCGMVPSTLERVFEPGASSKKGRGRRVFNTGYGMANARKFVAACGGSIGIESQPGAGTAVTLLLPRAPEGGAD